MHRRVRRPGSASLAQLFSDGYITEQDVCDSGTVSEEIRTRAERLYAASVVPPRAPPRVEQVETPVLESAPQVADACCVCYAAERTHAPSPCYHLCVCTACSNHLSKCPLCRGRVDKFHRIWL